MELIEQLQQAVISGNEEGAKTAATEILKAKLDIVKVVEHDLASAMKVVGEKFEKEEFFLADLMSAAEAMKMASNILMSSMDRESISRLKREQTGVVVIGTVKGDQHDIGKNLVALLLRANHFEVHDLGVDVGPQEFVERAKEANADIIGLSALLTTTSPYQAEVINYLRDSGSRGEYDVVIGGGATSQEWADQIGAEGWAPDASRAVEVFNEIRNKKT